LLPNMRAPPYSLS